MSFIRGFGQFWYDFIIGDDWKIAVAITFVLLVGVALLMTSPISHGALAIFMGVMLLVAFSVALLIDVRD